MAPPLPRVEKLPHNRGYQFVLDDKPFLILGGELNNSSFSSVEYMRERESSLKVTNLNTLLGSVSWEQIEPEEGIFDFEEFDKCLEWAREAGFRIVLLWFGAFKNGMSTYVPHWVKRDVKRFPRVHIADPSHPTTDRVIGVVSVFNSHLLDSDSRAFAALLSHIKDFDESYQTVIMVQVENEPGILGDSRDRSPGANEAFQSPPPEAVVSYLHSTSNNPPAGLRSLKYPSKPGKSWEETFGVSKRTDEVFMAYHYARYHNSVAAAGKAVYNLPFYANAWLLTDNAGLSETLFGDELSSVRAPSADDVIKVSGGAAPGVYPSGGAVTHMLPLWRHFGPDLAFIAPDIYVEEYDTVCQQYASVGQALFVPEQRRDENGALWSWQALGSRGAIGVSPFGIDNIPGNENHYADHYAQLVKAAPFILQARQEGRRVEGFHFDRFKAGQKDPSPVKTFNVGEWHLKISRASIFGHPAPGYGIIIHLAENRFLLLGEGYEVRFESTNQAAVFNGLLVNDEVNVGVDGGLVKDRFMNGDESVHPVGEVVRMPSRQPDYGGYHIAVNIPSRTRMALAEPYYLVQGE